MVSCITNDISNYVNFLNMSISQRTEVHVPVKFRVIVMVFNATFNNISVISWWSV